MRPTNNPLADIVSFIRLARQKQTQKAIDDMIDESWEHLHRLSWPHKDYLEDFISAMTAYSINEERSGKNRPSYQEAYHVVRKAHPEWWPHLSPENRLLYPSGDYAYSHSEDA